MQSQTIRGTAPPFLSFRAGILLILPILIGVGAVARGADEGVEVPGQPAQQTAYEQKIRPAIVQYCSKCHNADRASGSINFAVYADVFAVQKDQTTWRKAIAQLHDRTMPPPGAPQPSDTQRLALLEILHKTLDGADDSLIPKNPGRILIHRLSRNEYNNTVRDLFGVNSKPADQFPADGGGGGGFDNNADTLFIPPILMERCLSAAGAVVDEAKPSTIFFVYPGKGHPGKGLTPRAAARRIVVHFAARAYRRPVTSLDVDRLMSLYDAALKRGESFQGGVKYTLKALLVSPWFLFRVERDQNSTAPYRISDYELASRLSYFLWASMPDDTLFHLAAEKRLHDPAVLDQQVERMLRSPKSRSFTESFVGQWLRVDELLTTVHPDPTHCPDYTPTLRDSMLAETTDFFDSLVRDDQSLLSLLDADYTYLNEELARHYGIPGVQGSEMRRVRLTDGARGGILTMGSVLTLTSFPQRTSPVLRGKWVLEAILGTPSPPPPPDAGGLPADDAPRDGLTLRQRLEKHRQRPQCAGCHARMDPIGFGLENYGPTGSWRTEIGGKAVDAAGVLVSGEKFSGPIELKRLLLAQKDLFVRNITDKMMSYALGRGLEPYDIPAVRKITSALAKNNYRSSTLILGIVSSYPFQYRRNL